MYSSFASMNATVDDLTIVFRDYNGTVRYEYTLTNPNIVAVTPSTVPTASSTEVSVALPVESGPSRKRKSFLSWGFWSEQAKNASNQDIAMASGGVAAMGLMLFLCYSVYKRQHRGKDDQTKEHKSRTPNLMHSPRQGRAGAFYSRKPYAELNDVEQGRGYDDLEFSDDEEPLPVLKQQPHTKYLPLQDTTSTAPNSLETDASDEPDGSSVPTQDPSPRASSSGTPREPPAEATAGPVSRSRASTLRDSSGGSHHSRTSTVSDSRASVPQGSPHSTAHSSVYGSGEVAVPLQDCTTDNDTGRSRASTLKSPEHSRASSRSDAGHSQAADLYSTNRSAQQMDIGTAWLQSTHSRNSSSSMPAPPPPSPERRSIAEHMLAMEAHNPLLSSSNDGATAVATPTSTGKPPRRPFVPFHARHVDSNTGGIGQESPESTSGGPLPRSSPPKDPNSLLSSDDIRLAPLTLVKPHRRTTTS